MLAVSKKTSIQHVKEEAVLKNDPLWKQGVSNLKLHQALTSRGRKTIFNNNHLSHMPPPQRLFYFRVALVHSFPHLQGQ